MSLADGQEGLTGTSPLFEVSYSPFWTCLSVRRLIDCESIRVRDLIDPFFFCFSVVDRKF